MSEATRQRWLRVTNRLQELRSKHPDPPEPEPEAIVGPPSWGPDGSLARALLDELQYAAIMRHDRARHRPGPPQTPPVAEDPHPGVSAPDPQNRVLSASEAMSRLDHYGETALFACPSCGAESAKASVPLDLWRCTRCNTNGKASRLPRELGPRGAGW